MYFYDGESMKLIYMNCLSRNYYPQGQSNTDKNCGRMIRSLNCLGTGFFFSKKKKKWGGGRANLPKKHTHKTLKGQKTKTNMHSHPTEMLSQHSHTTLHINKKCRDGDHDLCQANKQNYNRKIRRLQDQGSIS